ncbi:hypothetical protein CspHIS471_0602760 [Cutaneotrichosporon sp. HIS471]|nr:hypothetical protein CspHIS471_0602760 [Cutaneotrichosporon sp. HIS471]
MSHTPGRSPRDRPNPNAYSDTEERDNDMLFLENRANRSFPEDRYPDDTVDDHHFSNATFPGGRLGPRDLRRTNAFHSRVARSIRDFDHPDDRVDEKTSSQETDDGPVPRRNTARWQGGRLPDSTGMAEQPVRESRRYHPYDMEADRTPTTTRLRGQSRALLERHRYQRRESNSRNGRRSSNSTEEGDETLYDRDDRHEHASPKKTSHHPIQDRQAIDAMLQHYIKSLSEQ